MGTINTTSGNIVNRFSISKSDNILSYEATETDADFEPLDTTLVERQAGSLPRPTYDLVTDGLVLYCDASVPSGIGSYSGLVYDIPYLPENTPSPWSGLLWQGMQPGVNMDFFMYNGIEFDSEAGGCFVFDGIDDFGYGGASGQVFVYSAGGSAGGGVFGPLPEAATLLDLPSSGTISQWLKPSEIKGFPFFVTGGQTDGKDGGGGWWYGVQTHNGIYGQFYYGRGYNANNNLGSVSAQENVFQESANKWIEITCTWEEGKFVALYANGKNVGRAIMNPVAYWPVNAYILGGPQRTSTSARIARSFAGKMATTFMYNRALTDAEIEQNYLSLVGRFPKLPPY